METTDIKQRKWIGHVIKGNSLVKLAIEGRLEKKKPEGRPRTKIIEKTYERQQLWKFKSYCS